MVTTLLAALLGLTLVDPPKRPYLGFPWRMVELQRANEMKVLHEYGREPAIWIRLYGVDIPEAGHKGYSGARQDLEILLGRFPEVYIEDENSDHPITRNAFWVDYVWTRGKLIQFELVRDGWATVNEEGKKGRYGKFLVAAEDEARRFHDGMWSTH